jgi:hypothetical protein
VLVEQGAQIDEDLLGQAFDIDREVKTDGRDRGRLATGNRLPFRIKRVG